MPSIVLDGQGRRRGVRDAHHFALSHA
jgi:hypothetical protein